jgi:hypothetical protein
MILASMRKRSKAHNASRLSTAWLCRRITSAREARERRCGPPAATIAGCLTVFPVSPRSPSRPPSACPNSGGHHRGHVPGWVYSGSARGFGRGGAREYQARPSPCRRQPERADCDATPDHRRRASSDREMRELRRVLAILIGATGAQEGAVPQCLCWSWPCLSRSWLS